MKDKESRLVTPAEIRRDAEAAMKGKPDDVLIWIEAQRDLAAADRLEAFDKGDNLNANIHDKRCDRFAAAAREISSLRKRVEAFTESFRTRGGQ